MIYDVTSEQFFAMLKDGNFFYTEEEDGVVLYMEVNNYTIKAFHHRPMFPDVMEVGKEPNPDDEERIEQEWLLWKAQKLAKGIRVIRARASLNYKLVAVDD